MRRRICFVLLLLAAFVQVTAADTDSEREIRFLRAENKMLRAKVKSQQKEIVALKAEIVHLKTGVTSQPATKRTPVIKIKLYKGYDTIEELGGKILKGCPAEIPPPESERWSDAARKAMTVWLQKKHIGKRVAVKGIPSGLQRKIAQFKPQLITHNGRYYRLIIKLYASDAWKAELLGLAKSKLVKTNKEIIKLRLERRLAEGEAPIIVRGKITKIAMAASAGAAAGNIIHRRMICPRIFVVIKPGR
ncbi:MAG: hypothetical protein KAV00_07125 [Phycisphaerae bacterium]|nr:hypothetical protein [Phycisphaerae bacterium]